MSQGNEPKTTVNVNLGNDIFATDSGGGKVKCKVCFACIVFKKLNCQYITIHTLDAFQLTAINGLNNICFMSLSYLWNCFYSFFYLKWKFLDWHSFFFSITKFSCTYLTSWISKALLRPLCITNSSQSLYISKPLHSLDHPALKICCLFGLPSQLNFYYSHFLNALGELNEVLITREEAQEFEGERRESCRVEWKCLNSGEAKVTHWLVRLLKVCFLTNMVPIDWVSACMVSFYKGRG